MSFTRKNYYLSIPRSFKDSREFLFESHALGQNTWGHFVKKSQLYRIKFLAKYADFFFSPLLFRPWVAT